VRSTERAQVTGRGEQGQGYDQTFEEMVSFHSTGGGVLRPGSNAPAGLHGLQSRGTHQTLGVSAIAKPVFTFANGSPAVVRTALGKGAVYYSAASLQNEDYSRLLDALMDESKMDRPLRVSQWEIEARMSRSGDRRLIYVVNFRGQPVEVPLQLRGASISSLHELRRDETIAGNSVRLAPGETGIYEVLQ
jgi:hypothetical protein